MVKLTFLGTGGGRFATLFQKRATGGLYVEDGSARLHIDPGPGALTQLHAAGLDPTRTTGLLVSHAHLDHANDASMVIRGMTRGGLEVNGELIASESVVSGWERAPPVVAPAELSRLSSWEAAKAGSSSDICGVKVDLLPTEHRDPTNVGFRLHTSQGTVTYYTDSVYKETFVEAMKGTRVLVLGVTRPRGAPIEGHLSTDDAARIATDLAPELLIMTHLGMKVLREGPDKEARFVQETTGVRTVAARDLMKVIVKDSIKVHGPPRGPTPGKPRRRPPRRGRRGH